MYLRAVRRRKSRHRVHERVVVHVARRQQGHHRGGVVLGVEAVSELARGAEEKRAAHLFAQ